MRADTTFTRDAAESGDRSLQPPTPAALPVTEPSPLPKEGRLICYGVVT